MVHKVRDIPDPVSEQQLIESGRFYGLSCETVEYPLEGDGIEFLHGICNQ